MTTPLLLDQITQLPPQLYGNLQICLRTIYGNSNIDAATQKTAHDWLVSFQRCRISSPDVKLQGSTFLACLYLVTQSLNNNNNNNNNNANNIKEYEVVFACQSMVSRLNKFQLEDAIDTVKEEALWCHFSGISSSTTCEYNRKTSNNTDSAMRVLRILAKLLCVYSNQIGATGVVTSLLSRAMVLTALRICYSINNNNNVNQHSNHQHEHNNILSLLTQSMLDTNNSMNAMTAVLTALPETIITTNTLSMERALHSRAILELRSDATMTSLMDVLQRCGLSHEAILAVFSAWVRCIPLSGVFVEFVVSVIVHVLSSADVSSVRVYDFLSSLAEGAGITVDNLAVQFRLPNAGKRIKKRKNKKKNNNNSNVDFDTLNSECMTRQHTCCLIANLAIPHMLSHLEAALQHTQQQDTVADVVLCHCALAEVILPYILQHATNGQLANLFKITTQGLQFICKSSSTKVRALVLEPLLKITVGNDCATNLAGVHDCAMELAVGCAYGVGYFERLDVDSDFDLEVERNDVREVIRHLGCAHASILQQLLHTCTTATPIALINNNIHLPPEPALHALSALAKSLNILSKTPNLVTNDVIIQILTSTMQYLAGVSQQLITCFEHDLHMNVLHIQHIFPICRLLCMAIASCSPMMDNLVFDSSDNAKQLLVPMVSMALLSLRHIPELTAASTLATTCNYDIRGAMRGPGGEDHVACITLMRMCREARLKEVLINFIGPKFIQEMCGVYVYLKEHGVSNDTAGPHTTPMTRRIVLQTVSHIADVMGDNLALEAIFRTTIADLKCDGGTRMDANKVRCMAEAMFDLCYFSAGVGNLLVMSNSNDSSDDVSISNDALQGVINVLVMGYAVQGVVVNVSDNWETCVQWSRLRGAMYTFLSHLATDPSMLNGLTQTACNLISTLIQAECTAVSNNNANKNNVFLLELISEEVLSAGAFIQVLGDALLNMMKQSCRHEQHQLQSYHILISTLHHHAGMVLDVIMSSSNSNSSASSATAVNYVDPRPALTEAWYLSMNALLSCCNIQSSNNSNSNDNATACSSSWLMNNSTVQYLLGDSCYAAVVLFLLQSVGVESLSSQEHADNSNVLQQNNTTMSMDAPHTLVMMDFLKLVLAVPNILQHVGSRVRQQLKLNLASGGSSESAAVVAAIMNQNADESACIGGAVLSAALFRGSSGGLPPWAIEGIPDLFSSIFTACKQSDLEFGAIIIMAMDIQLDPAAATENFGFISPGKRLAGRYFEKLSDITRRQFIACAQNAASQNSADGWRRFKSAVKQLCGGKKKDSGFDLKPGMISWDCIRI